MGISKECFTLDPELSWRNYDVNEVIAEYKLNGVNGKALYDHVMIILCHPFQGHYLIDGDALSTFNTRLSVLIGACIHGGVTVFNIA